MMYEERTWEEFAAVGLFWWINRSLCLLGWTLIRVYDDSDPKTVVRVYPAYTGYRGFEQPVEARGFENLTRHLAERAPRLLRNILSPGEE